MLGADCRPGTDTPLIGREHELELLAQAARHAPSVVVLEGEAGVGKTRLVSALAATAASAGRRVLVGRCHRLREPFPLGVVVDALRTLGVDAPAPGASPLLGALRPLLPELAARLPPQPGPLGDALAERHRLFRALRELLAGLGDGICVLEDLHWADASTLEFLSFLLADPPDELVLVLTNRPEEQAASISSLTAAIPAGARTFALQIAPLDAGDVARLAASVSGRAAVSEDFGARLHDWTGGIPAAVEDVLRLLCDREELDGYLHAAGRGPEDLPVPRSIRDAMRARTAGLSTGGSAIAAAAAVVSAPADEALLTQVAGLPASEGATALVEALSAGVVCEREDGLYAMRHRLAEKAVYESVAGPLRRQLHLRAGRALEDSARRPLAEIAYHLQRAGTDGWVRYAEDAAIEARARGDDLAAAGLLEAALDAPDLSRTDRLRMAQSLGSAALLSASHDKAIAIIRRVLEEETIAPARRGELRSALSMLLGNAGETSARDEAVLAVTELRRRPGLAVGAMLNLARPDWDGDGGVEEHMAWLQRAVDAATALGDPATQIAVLAQRAAILMSVGDPGGWAAVRAIPVAGTDERERHELVRGYHAAAASALGLGYHDRADSLLSDAERLHAGLDQRSLGMWLAGTRLSIDWYGGRWVGLEDRAHALMEETVTSPALHACNQFVLGALLLAQGNLDAAYEALSCALETTQRVGGLSLLVTLVGRLARLHLEREDAAAAWERAAVGIEALRPKGIWLCGRTVVPEAVTALLLLERQAQARELVTEFATGLRGRDAPAARAALASARGAIAHTAGRRADAARHFARAEAAWRRLHNPYEAARARERRAGCLLGGPDDETGRDLLPATLGAFQRLQAAGDARRVRATLIALGVWRGGRRGYGDALSPREAQVARLAGAGRTNREIAAALFISPRTVEIHVASALHKLGLRSRHALGARAATPRSA